MRNAVLTTSNYAFYKSNTLRFSELLHYTNLISHRLSQQLHSVLSIYTLPHISHLLRPPYVIGQANIFLPCGFYLSFFLLSLFSSPNLSGRRLDVYHTSAPGVTLVRIWNADMKYAARGLLKIQNAKMTQKIAICASSHNFVWLYLSSQLRHVTTIGKKLVKQRNLPTCPHNMGNFGPLATEIGSVVWETPANFNGFRVFAASLHDTVVVGVSQTLRR